MISHDAPSIERKAHTARKPLRPRPDCGCLIKASKQRCGPCASEARRRAQNEHKRAQYHAERVAQ